MGNDLLTLQLLPILIAVVIAIIILDRPIVFFRSLLYGLLLPVLVSVSMVVFIGLEGLFSGEEITASMLSSQFGFMTVMGVLVGFSPAMMTVVICDVLWIRWRLRFWFVPMVTGGLLSFIYTYFFLNEQRIESNLIFVGMGSLGGLFFTLLRQRLLKLTDNHNVG